MYAVWIVNYSTLRPLSLRNKIGDKFGSIPYSVTQFVLHDPANNELLPNTNHYLLKKTIVSFSKKSAPSPNHVTTPQTKPKTQFSKSGKGLLV